MTQQIPYHTPGQPLGFRNRKGMLLAWGIVMIVFGAIAGCLVLAMPAALFFQPAGVTTTVVGPTGMKVTTTAGQPASKLQIRTAIVAMAMYAAIAVALIWVGIGSIMARRWVRPIVLTIGTLWLLMGLAGTVNFIISLPIIGQAMRQSSAPPAAMRGVMVVSSIVGGIVSMFLLIVLPALVVWLFSSKDVLRTLEYYDPEFRWTDRCPLPVLAMSITCALLAAFVIFGGLQPAVPMFGVVIVGPVAWAVMLLVAATFAAAAVLVYRQRRAGWLFAVVVLMLLGLSSVVSMVRLDVVELTRAMGAPPEQVQLMQSVPRWNHYVMAGMWAALLTAGLVYAWRIRHYFDRHLERSLPPAAEG